MKTTFLSRSAAFLKKPIVIGVLLLVALAVIGGIFFSSEKIEGEVVKAERMTVSEEVEVSGKVKPATAVDLAFDVGGRVAAIPKKVGDKVVVGDTIATLETRTLYADLAEAQAGVRIERARLAELEMGTRPEALEVTKTKTENAERNVILARTNLLTSLQSAYSSADDAVRNKVDQLFTKPRSAYPDLIFSASAGSERGVETGRVEVEDRLKQMDRLLETATASASIAASSVDIKQDLAEIKLFLDNLAFVLNSYKPDINWNAAQIAEWKADVSVARTQVNSALTDIFNADEKLANAESALLVARGELHLENAGTLNQQIEAARARVAQTEAAVARVYADIAKATIKSPIAGIVTRQDVELAETIGANVPVVSVISDAQFEIEANIPEADIPKLSIGNEAIITLDAYGSDAEFAARIVKIDPAETIVDGVPTYKTTFQFIAFDDRVKSGMTANVAVRGQVRENVIAVPYEAISSRLGKKYVTVQEGETTREVQVRTGIRGSSGMVEVVEGLSEGDSIVISEP